MTDDFPDCDDRPFPPTRVPQPERGCAALHPDEVFNGVDVILGGSYALGFGEKALKKQQFGPAA